MMKSVLSLFLAVCSLMLATASAENLRALGRRNCPNKNPLDGNNMRCNLDAGIQCGYESESCCGETYDSIKCECGSNGQWACFATEACMWPICERCPDTQPIAGFRCSVLDTITCGYGTESCCGQTYSSNECQCWGGYWACLATDACMYPQCEEPKVPLVEEVFP